MELNSVYKSPEQSARDTSEMSDLELRNYYAVDEACVQFVAWLYIFCGSFLVVLTLVVLMISIDMYHFPLFFMSLFTLIIAITYVILGWGMRHYDLWSRNPARFAAIVMIFFAPVGTIIGIFCFILLKERAHKEIFSLKYHALLLSDPLHSKHQKIWVPMVIGALTAILITLLVYLQRHVIITFLTGGYRF